MHALCEIGKQLSTSTSIPPADNIFDRENKTFLKSEKASVFFAKPKDRCRQKLQKSMMGVRIRSRTTP